MIFLDLIKDDTLQALTITRWLDLVNDIRNKLIKEVNKFWIEFQLAELICERLAKFLKLKNVDRSVFGTQEKMR